VQFAQRHQQQMMIAKADDLGQRHTVVAGGLNPANLANGCNRPFRFDNKSDDLHDAPHSLGDASDPHALKRGVEAIHTSS
jgi:hypothetical protein